MSVSEGRERSPTCRMRSKLLATEPPACEPAIGNQPLFCRGISLVEYVISEREKDGMPLDALRWLNNVRMVANDQIRSLLNQPMGLCALRCIHEFLILVAPVNRNHNQVRQLTCLPQFFGDFV